jgi:hypothetical protein
MWSMQCNVEFGYQLSICSRIEENHGKPWSSWSTTTDSNDLYKPSVRSTQKTKPFCCWGSFTDPLLSNGRPVAARVRFRENVFTEPFPSNGSIRHNIFSCSISEVIGLLVGRLTILYLIREMQYRFVQTNWIEKSSVREATIHSANQEIPRISWNWRDISARIGHKPKEDSKQNPTNKTYSDMNPLGAQ